MTLITAGLAMSWPGRGQAQEESKAPPREDVTLRTWDGVDIGATFYGSTLGKEAVPIIMLHQYKGSRADFQDLALALQQAGHAVIAPDLRGHGQSTRQVLPNGRERQLNVAQLNRGDIEAMAYASPQGGGDVEVCKSFLMAKNNAGELNIDKLCVIGAEMGATVAVNWAAVDWSWPQLPNIRQGRDVKALVLLSPSWAFKGVAISPLINNRNLAPHWSWLIVAGAEEPGAFREAQQVNRSLEGFFPPPPANEMMEKKALFFVPLATSLQGTKLLAAKSFNLPADIAQFIDLRLVKKNFPWTDRRMRQ